MIYDSHGVSILFYVFILATCLVVTGLFIRETKNKLIEKKLEDALWVGVMSIYGLLVSGLVLFKTLWLLMSQTI